jgi:hypothetical protein
VRSFNCAASTFSSYVIERTLPLGRSPVTLRCCWQGGGRRQRPGRNPSDGGGGAGSRRWLAAISEKTLRLLNDPVASSAHACALQARLALAIDARDLPVPPLRNPSITAQMARRRPSTGLPVQVTTSISLGGQELRAYLARRSSGGRYWHLCRHPSLTLRSCATHPETSLSGEGPAD